MCQYWTFKHAHGTLYQQRRNWKLTALFFVLQARLHFFLWLNAVLHSGYYVRCLSGCALMKNTWPLFSLTVIAEETLWEQGSYSERYPEQKICWPVQLVTFVRRQSSNRKQMKLLSWQLLWTVHTWVLGKYSTFCIQSFKCWVYAAVPQISPIPPFCTAQNFFSALLDFSEFAINQLQTNNDLFKNILFTHEVSFTNCAQVNLRNMS